MRDDSSAHKRLFGPVSAVTQVGLLTVALGAITALAAESKFIGPVTGEREFAVSGTALSGTGSNDQDFDSSSLGFSGELGWYISPQTLVGVRQSVSYADLDGDSVNYVNQEFWNGSTRGFVDYHFGDAYWRPFAGAGLGAVYGDGISDSAFCGLELGLKYYVLPKTFLMGRAEYQWFFGSSGDTQDNFDGGAWAFTISLGYNF